MYFLNFAQGAKVWVSAFLSAEDKISNYQPKVWVSSFPSVEGNRISALAIMKQSQNGPNFVHMHCMANFQITDVSPPPQKVWLSGFPM